ncbi:MAG: DUF499 domain-containing protein [Anaerolineae bacterium]|nr:DUF499 domain-containing protein [Anaerolineae bacterium]
MQSLKQLCVPRNSVFDTQRRDTVLDLNDLVGDRISPDNFFAENHITEGMKILLEQSFRRLEGKSSQGIFKLKQAMGGGKTHNLITLGLLARHPQFRQQVMEKFYTPDPDLGPVKVVAFTGRDSDISFGIWGEIAEQLGKKDHFKDHYSPLRAPGQTAWETLFAGEKVLILLDELPAYFVDASSVTVGNSDLAQVTATALSNLLVAIGREAGNNVCLVLTDLTGSYEKGSQQISTVLSNLDKETHRSAMTLEPVRLNSDELYHILRRRIFQELPTEHDISQIAQGYAHAIRNAKQMDITSESPEQFAARIMVSYPFHPAIRDLYARFRENPGFQQTRGLIRLMRIIVSRLWRSDIANKRFLIAAHDLDFNDTETSTEISQINNKLDNAIAHDIADNGGAVAERLDSTLGSTDTQDACRLVLISSLANVPNAVVGLSIPELIAYLAEPGRDLSRLKNDVLARLSTEAWYLHGTRDGKLYFRDVQNLTAKLETQLQSYDAEQAIRELRIRLDELFKPVDNYCYQRVLALPAIDEIELDPERVTLLITEPYTGTGLRQELRDFYNQTTWQNRVAFLTGTKNTYDRLVEIGKRLRAIDSIIKELIKDKLADSDPQMIEARTLNDNIMFQFNATVRETFTTLWYPTVRGLLNADFMMQFEANRYRGEQQILQLLKDKRKYEEEISGEMFRKKCESRLFGNSQSLPWREIKQRAASASAWQWHHPNALDDLRNDCLRKDIWREDGGYIDKGPFPPPKTSVIIDEQLRDDNTGEVTLRLTPVHGDTIYYDVGADASTASAKVEGSTLTIKELRVSFLVVDSAGQHDTGEVENWINKITLQHRTFQCSRNKCMELKAAPEAAIFYTTDGSDPKVAGGEYNEPFIIPSGAPFVLAYAQRDGIVSLVERFPIDWDQDNSVQIDPRIPTIWKPTRRFGFNSTRDSYAFLDRLKKHRGTAAGVSLTISGVSGDRDWIQFNTNGEKKLEPLLIEEALDALRKLQTNGQVQLNAGAVHFEMGQDLLDWVEDEKLTLKSGEVTQ